MTNKEQIMIDGCNVGGCKYLNTFSDCDGYHYYCDLADDIKNEYCEHYRDCYFKQLARKTQECEELKRKLSNQEQLYQNEIEIYNESCLQLRQENDDLYLERLALNTANSGINSLLEIKEQENDRYRKALDEIENFMNYEFSGQNEWVKTRILDIINKAKDGKNDNSININ